MHMIEFDGENWPTEHAMHGVADEKSWSYIPREQAVHMVDEREANFPAAQEVQGVAGLASWSVCPGGQFSHESVDVNCPGEQASQ